MLSRILAYSACHPANYLSQASNLVLSTHITHFYSNSLAKIYSFTNHKHQDCSITFWSTNQLLLRIKEHQMGNQQKDMTMRGLPLSLLEISIKVKLSKMSHLTKCVLEPWLVNPKKVVLLALWLWTVHIMTSLIKKKNFKYFEVLASLCTIHPS